MMFSKKEFLEEEKDCASMLGMTLKEYRDYCNETKVPVLEKESNEVDYEYDNSFLKFLNIDESMLKKRKSTF